MAWTCNACGVTDSDCLRITPCTDPDIQAHWLKTAILCDSVDDLFREGSDNDQAAVPGSSET
jgi:hypothetical protein